MNVKEQWQSWRGLTEMPAGLKELFLDWVDAFTAEAEDPENVFAKWRSIPAEQRRSLLGVVLDGKVATVGALPEFEFGLFFGLYQVLQHRRCFVVTPLPLHLLHVRQVLKKVSELPQLVLKAAGGMLGAPNVQLGDCSDADLVLADFYQIMSALHRKRELFEQNVQAIFFLEADVALYSDRIILFDNGVARASGFVYNSSASLDPEWKNSNDFADIPKELSSIQGLVCGGVTSMVDKYTASEVDMLSKGMFKAALQPSEKPQYVAYTFRTSESRNSALVNDVIKANTNALIITINDALLHELQEEFRKSGMECMITSRCYDIPTFFSLSNDKERDKNKILILRGIPSPMVLAEAKLATGAIFVAEHLLASNMHMKALAIGERLFELKQPMQMYFSLEDQLFSFYEKEGGFSKLFNFIDFTEKYDPWRQIRRVLAKAMLQKLHRIRTLVTEDGVPLLTTSLNSSTFHKPAKEQKVASKLDAPCFCGSGKPFRECHGKKMK